MRVHHSGSVAFGTVRGGGPGRVVLAVMAALLPATVAAAAEGDLMWAETFGGTGSDYWYDPGLTRTRGRARAARRGSSGRR